MHNGTHWTKAKERALKKEKVIYKKKSVFKLVEIIKYLSIYFGYIIYTITFQYSILMIFISAYVKLLIKFLY